MIVEVLVAGRDCKQALTHERGKRVLDARRVAPIPEAAGKSPDEPGGPIGCA